MALSYRLTKTKGGSDRYGACECCGGEVNTTYMLVKIKRYTRKNGTDGQAQQGAEIFGHKNCLSKTTFLL